MGLPRPPPGMLLGVDLSVSQGEVDGAALRGAGVSFAWVKFTAGILGIDALGFRHAAVLDFLGTFRAYLALRDRTCGTRILPPALDLELRAAGVSPRAILDGAVAWLDHVEGELGRLAVLYLGPAYIETMAKLAGPGADEDLLALAERPLWLSHYTGDYARPPTVPPPWAPSRRETIWQASGGSQVSPNFATLPGSTTQVDVDFFAGTAEQLAALGGG